MRIRAVDLPSPSERRGGHRWGWSWRASRRRDCSSWELHRELSSSATNDEGILVDARPTTQAMAWGRRPYPVAPLVRAGRPKQQRRRSSVDGGRETSSAEAWCHLPGGGGGTGGADGQGAGSGGAIRRRGAQLEFVRPLRCVRVVWYSIPFCGGARHQCCGDRFLCRWPRVCHVPHAAGCGVPFHSKMDDTSLPSLKFSDFGSFESGWSVKHAQVHVFLRTAILFLCRHRSGKTAMDVLVDRQLSSM